MVDDFEHYGGTIGWEDVLKESLKEKNDPDHPGEKTEYSEFEPETSFQVLVKYNAKREKHQDCLK